MKSVLLLDVEATTLEPKTGSLIEVGAVLWSIEHRSIIECFSGVMHAAEHRCDSLEIRSLRRSPKPSRRCPRKQVAMPDHRPLPVSEGDVYSHPRGPEQVLIDHVTEDEVLLRVTDGNCGLIAARRMSRAEWDRIRDSHELRRSNG